MKQPCVYIITNRHNTTLYIGVTSNLIQRIYQHKNKLVKGFSSKYNLDKLVYFEQCGDMDSAILREKRVKKWHRDWKNRIIDELNPNWQDLYFTLLPSLLSNVAVNWGGHRLRGDDVRGVSNCVRDVSAMTSFGCQQALKNDPIYVALWHKPDTSLRWYDGVILAQTVFKFWASSVFRIR